MRYAPGTTAELTATISDSGNDPVTPTSVLVDIYDTDGTVVVNDGVPVNVSPGLYLYEYDIPSDADKGLWRIEWRIVVSGNTALGVEYFEVYDEQDAAPDEANVVFNSLLRSRIGEPKTDPLGDGSETLFTDFQIAMIYNKTSGNLNRATLEGWLWKMAYYSSLIDVTESGSDRPLSQKFKQAKEMVDAWRRFVGDDDAAAASAMAGRVVGKAVNLRCCDSDSSNPYPFSGYSYHVRMYPTHRLIIPAVLG